MGKLAALTRSFKKLIAYKKWYYLIAANDKYLISFAITDVGYLGNVFFTIVDLRTKKKIFDRSLLGIPNVILNVKSATEGAVLASFQYPGVHIQLIKKKESVFFFQATFPNVRVLLHLFLPDTAPLFVTGHARKEGEISTKKINLIKISGHLLINKDAVDFSNGMGGLDYTFGYLPYKTYWKWGFGFGRLEDGTPFGFNIANGNNMGGENENALWIQNEMFPLSDCTFLQEQDKKSWKMETKDSTLKLEFSSFTSHLEKKNFLFVKSNFSQQYGYYSGEITDPKTKKSLKIQNVIGVAENQMVRW